MSSPRFRIDASLRAHLILAAALACALVFGVGGLAATTELSGAIIAPGQLVVMSDVKKVQHPNGGIVGELLIGEGDLVKAGDVLIRLDQTKATANLAILKKTLDELLARRARDEAELAGSDNVVFPADLIARASDEEVTRVVNAETKLFDLRRVARAGKKAQFNERILQFEQQIVGLEGQIVAKGKEISLVQEELEGVEELWRKKLVQFTRVVALRRDAARGEGELGALTATAAETRGKVNETKLQIIQLDQDLASEVGNDLAQLGGKITETIQRQIPAEDEIRRDEVRAPQNGFVHQLSVHTIGGVIAAGEQIMLIVPDMDGLRVEARIQPADIDQVYAHQRAVLKFAAFNQRTTPEVNGEVSMVSADVSQDTKTGANFFSVRISMTANEIARLGRVKLVPGMPVEAFIETSPRTVMSYLTKPLSDQIAKTFREK
jgi:HlyD family secretion protein